MFGQNRRNANGRDVVGADDIPKDAIAYELYIELAGIKPAIWRTLRVHSDSTIADLHYTIQLSMKWGDYHLHRFVINGCEYGIAHEGGVWFDDDAAEVMISQLHFREGDQFVYEYDFGDCWEHDIVVEEILPIDPRVTYPVCTGGHRAGPPEDCGGAWGFMSRYNGRRKGARTDRFDRRALNLRLKQYALGNEDWQRGLDG